MPTSDSPSQPAHDAAALAFVEKSLGFASSHPLYARRKAVRMLRWPLALLTVAGGWFMWKGATLDFRWIIEALQNRSWPVLVAALGLVLMVSFVATAMLVMRVSASRRFMAGVAEDRLSWGGVGLGVGAAALAGLIFYMLPRWLTVPGMDPAVVRKASLLAAAVPYVLTLTLLDLFAPSTGVDGKPNGWRRIWLYLAGLWGMVCLISFAGSLRPAWAEMLIAHLPLAKIPLLGQLLGGLAGSALQAALKIFAAAALVPFFWLLGEWTLSGIPEWGMSALPKPVPSPDEAGTEDPPAWISDLSGHFNAKCLAPERRANPAPLETTDRLDHMFGSIRPSVDQAAVLNRFLSLNQDETGAMSDFFVVGENGSGKTTSLVACAVAAAVVRGGLLAVWVPDAAGRRSVARQVATLIRRNGLEGLVRAEEATSVTFLNWLDCHARLMQRTGSDDRSPEIEFPFPEILVATPQDWEELFFGRFNTDTRRRSALRSLLLGCGAILLDDVASPAWTHSQATHLPFLLDKQRLLLATEDRRLQVVATTTPLLHEIALTALGTRLFGRERRADQLPVRPWQQELPWRLQLRGSNLDELLTTAACRCLGHGVRVVVFLEGVSHERQKELQGRIARRTAENNSKADGWMAEPVRILGSLADHMEETDTSIPRAVFFFGHVDDPAVLSLASRFSDGRTALVGLVGDEVPVPASQRAELSRPTCPVFAAREAVPLMLAHLRSAVVHLNVDTPIHRNSFCSFGFQPVDNVPGPEIIGSQGWKVDPSIWFNLDPAEGAASPPSPSEAVFPMVSLGVVGQGVLGPQPVIFAELPPQSAGYRLRADGRAIEFGGLPDPWLKRRIAIWLDRSRTPLGRIDLAALAELRLRDGDQWFWCSDVKTDAQGRVNLVGDLWRGDGSEPYLPVLSLHLRPFKIEGQETATRVSGFRQEVRPGVRWLRLCSVLKSQERAATERVQLGAGIEALIPGFEVIAKIHGGANESGHISRFGHPIDFTYPAAVSVLLLGVPLPGENAGAYLDGVLGKEWETGSTSEIHPERPFWPELTLALQTALGTVAPRLLQFCRMAAFRLPRHQDLNGGAAVFFVEPQATAGTLDRIMPALLETSDLANKQVVPAAVAALSAKRWLGPRFLREDPLDQHAASDLLGFLSASPTDWAPILTQSATQTGTDNPTSSISTNA